MFLVVRAVCLWLLSSSLSYVLVEVCYLFCVISIFFVYQKSTYCSLLEFSRVLFRSPKLRTPTGGSQAKAGIRETQVVIGLRDRIGSASGKDSDLISGVAVSKKNQAKSSKNDASGTIYKGHVDDR